MDFQGLPSAFLLPCGVRNHPQTVPCRFQHARIPGQKARCEITVAGLPGRRKVFRHRSRSVQHLFHGQMFRGTTGSAYVTAAHAAKNHSMLKNSIVGHLDAAYIMIRLCSSFLKARPFSYTQKLSPHSGPEWRNEGTENESLPKKTGRHIRHLPVRDIFPVKSPHGRRSGLTDNCARLRRRVPARRQCACSIPSCTLPCREWEPAPRRRSWPPGPRPGIPIR